MTIRKREFLAGLGLGLGLAGAASAAEVGADLGAAPPQKKKEVPHRKVTTRNLFKAPPGYPNAVAVAPEGLWIAEQKAQGYGKSGKNIPEACWLTDWNGKLLKTVLTPSSNTSGMAYGNGHVWMGANGGDEGIYEVDMNSKVVSHRQIPLGPADNGGGCHGLMWHAGKLWIVANRLKAILRVDPKSWEPEFIIPITTDRWHGIAWDDSHTGGAIWMVTGSSDVDRYVMKGGKLTHTTISGLVKYEAATGKVLETAEFLPGTADPHGLAMHNGKLISCDAGVGPPGFDLTHSPSSGYIFEIDFV
ncbi:MAG TPA: hypothetical protein VHV26_00060 [Rhizomicrobium sp.]|nr:hypothetical protein [Rhizomicrobium sp.]